MCRGCVCLCIYVFHDYRARTSIAFSEGVKTQESLRSTPSVCFLLQSRKNGGLVLRAHPFPTAPPYIQVPWLPQAPPLELPLGEFPNPPCPQTHTLMCNWSGDFRMLRGGAGSPHPTPRQRISLTSKAGIQTVCLEETLGFGTNLVPGATTSE